MATDDSGAGSQNQWNKMLHDFPPLTDAGEPTYRSIQVEVAAPSSNGDMGTGKTPRTNNDSSPSGSQNSQQDGSGSFSGPNQPSSSDSVHSLGGYSEPPPIYAHPSRFGLPVPFLGPHIPHSGGATQFESHPLTRVVEFRTDIALGTVFQPTYPPGCPPAYDHEVFHPIEKLVITTAESVIHYINHPYTLCVNGRWIHGIGHFPLAQHLCICMDDGVRRYESVIRVDLPSPEAEKKREFTGTGIPNPHFEQVHYVIRPSRVTHKPTFKNAINKSLLKIIGPYASEQPYEINLSRQNGKYVHIDRHIDNFVTQTEPFQSYFYPIIHYALENIDLKLQGARYGFFGNFYRPILSAATILLSSGKLQLLDTVEIKMCVSERRIYCMSYDSTIARREVIMEGDEERQTLIIEDSCAYVDYSNPNKPNKSRYWGTELASVNPRIPLVFHPMKNLMYNPVLNPLFNPYSTYSFQIPPIPMHPTIPSAIPCNHFLGSHGTSAFPEIAVIPCIVPAQPHEFQPGPSAAPLNMSELPSHSNEQPPNDEAEGTRSSGSRLNPDAKDFFPRTPGPPSNLQPIPENVQFQSPAYFGPPFPIDPSSFMPPSCSPVVGPIYLNPYEDASEEEQDRPGPGIQHGNMHESRSHSSTCTDETASTLVSSCPSTESGQTITASKNGNSPRSPLKTHGPIPLPVQSNPPIPFPTLEINMSKSWSEEMEAHSFHEPEIFNPSPAVVAQAYDFNQFDDTGRPLRRAPSRDWNQDDQHRDWNNNEGSRTREWHASDQPVSEWNSNGPPSREWNSSGPPPREWNSSGPRPTSREWNSNGPPPREWNSNGPPPREWNSSGPPPREWRKPRFTRGGGGFRYRYAPSENAGGYNSGESGGYRDRENGDPIGNEYSGVESGGGRERDSGQYGGGYSDSPRGRGGYYGRGRGSRGGRGRFHNSEYRTRDEPPRRQLIVCSPRSSDIDLQNRSNRNDAPTPSTSGGRKDKSETTPRKTPRKEKKMKTPRKEEGQGQQRPPLPSPSPRNKNNPSTSSTGC